jgi:ComF family protein
MSGWLQRSPLVTLFLQSTCPLCQRPSASEFCPTCQGQLQQHQLTHSRDLWQTQSLFAWGHYGGNLKQALAALKYTHAPQLARPLGQWLAQAWLTDRESRPYTVVPIPLHADKQRQRGYNQAELLARSFCQFTGYQLQAYGLARTRSTEAQFNLSPQQRVQNLQQAFEIGRAFRDRPPTHPVLLLDDIYTTGATARVAMQTLRRHGVSVRGIVAIALAGEPGKGRKR